MTRNHPIVRKLLVMLAASGLLGAAFLAVSQSVLGVGINPCTSVDLSENPSQHAAPPQLVVITATSTGCTSPEYQFYLQAPGGAWVAKGAYSSIASLNWNTTGLAFGIWGISVHARGVGRTNSYDVYYIGTYNLSVAYCHSADLTPSVPEPQSPGGTITFTASSSNCPTPNYRFLTLPPGGTWTFRTAYSTTTTFDWNTTGLAPGTWTIGVWARVPGSKASHDAYGFITYRLSAPQRCTWVQMQAVPPSPVIPSTSVQFSLNNAAGCNTGFVEFWRLAPGGTWTKVQAYTTSLTWTWDTTGFAPGRYEIMLRVKETSSPNSYDTYVILTYFLGS